MSDEKRLGNAKNSGASIPPNAKKGSCLVRCSSYPSKGYEFLIRFANDKAIIGAKRIVQVNFNAGQVRGNDTELAGKFERINGVTWDCLHCKNVTITKCGCGQWSCSAGKNTTHQCPYCGEISTKRVEVDTINATSKPKNQGRLPSAPDKFLLTRK